MYTMIYVYRGLSAKLPCNVRTLLSAKQPCHIKDRQQHVEVRCRACSDAIFRVFHFCTIRNARSNCSYNIGLSNVRRQHTLHLHELGLRVVALGLKVARRGPSTSCEGSARAATCAHLHVSSRCHLRTCMSPPTQPKKIWIVSSSLLFLPILPRAGVATVAKSSSETHVPAFLKIGGNYRPHFCRDVFLYGL